MELHLELALVKLKESIAGFRQATDQLVADIDSTIKALPQNRVEEWRDERDQDINDQRNNAGYSIFRWSRENTGVYTARSINGVELRVYRDGDRQWYAKIGDELLNDEPLAAKSEAIAAIEKELLTVK